MKLFADVFNQKYLTEITKENAWDQFYKAYVPKDIFDFVVDNDPDKKGVHVGKFAKNLFLRIYKKAPFTIEDAKKAYEMISALGNKLPKPVEQYKSMDEILGSKESAVATLSDFQDDPENPIVFKSKKFTVRQIKNKEGAIKYGKYAGSTDHDRTSKADYSPTSRWCTSYTNDNNMYNSYKDDDLYIFTHNDASPIDHNLHSQLAIRDHDRTEWEKPNKEKLNVRMSQEELGLDEETFEFLQKILKDALGLHFVYHTKTLSYKLEKDEVTGEEIMVFKSFDLSDMPITTLTDLPWLERVVESVKKLFKSFDDYLKA